MHKSKVYVPRPFVYFCFTIHRIPTNSCYVCFIVQHKRFRVTNKRMKSFFLRFPNGNWTQRKLTTMRLDDDEKHRTSNNKLNENKIFACISIVECAQPFPFECKLYSIGSIFSVGRRFIPPKRPFLFTDNEPVYLLIASYQLRTIHYNTLPIHDVPSIQEHLRLHPGAFITNVYLFEEKAKFSSNLSICEWKESQESSPLSLLWRKWVFIRFIKLVLPAIEYYREYNFSYTVGVLTKDGIKQSWLINIFHCWK